MSRPCISDAIEVLERLNKTESGSFVQVFINDNVPVTIEELNSETVSFFVGKVFLVFTEQYAINARYYNRVITLESICTDETLVSYRKYASLFPSGIQFHSGQGNTDLTGIFDEFRAKSKSQSEEKKSSRVVCLRE